MELRDAKSMRALAHPVRWALIEAIGMEGTATAARCAELLGETQANCSFHLRQLAKYGLVEEAESSDRRARPWRLTSIDQNWSELQEDPEAGVAAAELTRVFLDREASRMQAYLRTNAAFPRPWREAAGMGATMTWLTAEELAELNKQVSELQRAYVDRISEPAKRPEGARRVRLFATGYPLPDTPYLER
jgi:DNA-binding MarR family transcriptional regulator